MVLHNSLGLNFYQPAGTDLKKVIPLHIRG